MTPDPRTTISRQPSRLGNDSSLNAIRVGSAPIGAGKAGLESAHEPHRRQAADARREGEPGFDRSEVERVVVGRQPQVGGELVAGRDPARLDLLVGDRPVGVGVEILARLEGGDLGLVDDDVEEDAARARPGSPRSG